MPAAERNNNTEGIRHNPIRALSGCKPNCKREISEFEKQRCMTKGQFKDPVA